VGELHSGTLLTTPKLQEWAAGVVPNQVWMMEVSQGWNWNLDLSSRLCLTVNSNVDLQTVSICTVEWRNTGSSCPVPWNVEWRRVSLCLYQIELVLIKADLTNGRSTFFCQLERSTELTIQRRGTHSSFSNNQSQPELSWKALAQNWPITKS